MIIRVTFAVAKETLLQSQFLSSNHMEIVFGKILYCTQRRGNGFSKDLEKGTAEKLIGAESTAIAVTLPFIRFSKSPVPLILCRHTRLLIPLE